ncbi:hypothetical protein E2C01_098975 [Portunus trituberculatus]|uniref:Uncharacterized protein n=1 Tax=Portunus trituberculatus TaxID=210409 RepID=A0A5B7JZ39_PORTR|nr:hypothetical protein [Portunus trituberculatus]
MSHLRHRLCLPPDSANPRRAVRYRHGR